MAKSTESLSKFLSYVLRHAPDSIGMTLDPQGWVAVDELLAKAAAAGKRLTRELLETIVAENDKQRFGFSEDGLRIRANQGHSVEVDLQLTPQIPPERLFHGTATRFLESIRAQGLRPGSRQEVHLSADRETAVAVGGRHGKPVVLGVRSAAMHAAGHVFTCSDNGVWLTAAVPPEFLEFPG